MARIRQSSSKFGVSNRVPRVSSTRALISRPYFDRHARAHVGNGHGRRGGGASRRRYADGVAHSFHAPPHRFPPPRLPPLRVPQWHRPVVATLNVPPPWR